MRSQGLTLALFVALNCDLQTVPSTTKTLPEGVLKGLAREAKEYCEDRFAEGLRKGCETKFAAHLRWRELSISPSGETAVLVENDNLGFCGSGGCALYLLVQQKDTKFTQVLGSSGGLGTLDRVSIMKKITKGHYDIQIAWSDRKTRSVYQWDGSQYSSEPESIAKAMFPNAPEKAQTVACFRALSPEMSMNAVVKKCGRPDEELGSGIYIFVWHLADGSTVSVGTPYLEKIGDIRYTDSSGKTSSLLGIKKKYP